MTEEVYTRETIIEKMDECEAFVLIILEKNNNNTCTFKIYGKSLAIESYETVLSHGITLAREEVNFNKQTDDQKQREN